MVRVNKMRKLKRNSLYCKKIRKCERCCQKRNKKMVCRKCCRTRKYCRKSRRSLSLLARRLTRRKLRRAFIIRSKAGLKKCKVYIRCGCFGRRKSKNNRLCCRRVNVCKKYISGSVRKYMNRMKKVIKKSKVALRRYRRFTYAQMKLKYHLLLAKYRRVFLKYMVLSARRVRYLRRCGIRPPKRHIKKYYKVKIFKKACPNNRFAKYLRVSRKVIKINRKNIKKLTRFAYKQKITTKTILKIGCKTKVLIKKRVKKIFHIRHPHRKQCRCPRVYRPVCGANGVNYSNSCTAACFGVKVVFNGKCSEKC